MWTGCVSPCAVTMRSLAHVWRESRRFDLRRHGEVAQDEVEGAVRGGVGGLAGVEGENVVGPSLLESTGPGLACPHLHYYPLGPELRLPRHLGALVVRGHQPQRRRRVGPCAQGLGPCHIRVRLLVLGFREYVLEDVHEGCRRVVHRPPRGGG